MKGFKIIFSKKCSQKKIDHRLRVAEVLMETNLEDLQISGYHDHNNEVIELFKL